MILPFLTVNSIDDSVAFYTEKLGFENTMLMPGPDGTNVFAFVKLGDFQIGLSIGEHADNAGEGVEFMLYIPEDQDLDTYFADVKAKGVTLDTDIKTQYWGDRTFTLRDPDGYVLTMSATVHDADMEHVADVLSGKAVAE